MKSTTISIYLLFVLTAGTMTSLFLTVLLIRLCVGIVAYYQFGQVDFSIADVTYAIKISVAGGLPLGIGSWVLAKMKANKDHSPPSDP
ncbi:hypothetical protein [Erwinia billingiae]|jgi:hypothetical protein|uniref:hypothetical protein n=1 Tax=Erwinia billingiae TaxID=182337 RepID=UPI0008FFD0DE|nr:hypothetical protein [Erwinia billingiae]